MDGTVRIWDLTKGGQSVTLRGQSGQAWDLTLAPDGRRLAAASGYRGKGEIQIWDLDRLGEPSR
jgi:WD40 repeat protein